MLTDFLWAKDQRKWRSIGKMEPKIDNKQAIRFRDKKSVEWKSNV